MDAKIFATTRVRQPYGNYEQAERQYMWMLVKFFLGCIGVIVLIVLINEFGGRIRALLRILVIEIRATLNDPPFRAERLRRELGDLPDFTGRANACEPIGQTVRNHARSREQYASDLAQLWRPHQERMISDLESAIQRLEELAVYGILSEQEADLLLSLRDGKRRCNECPKFNENTSSFTCRWKNPQPVQSGTRFRLTDDGSLQDGQSQQ